MATVNLESLFYAKLQGDDLILGATYDTPKKLAPAIDAKIAPSTSSSTLFAEGKAFATETALGEIKVDLETTDIPYDVMADLLGTFVDTNGVLTSAHDDEAPYVAIGFKAKKSNGSYLYVWLYKGKFSQNGEEFHTKEDKVQFQTAKISGTFVSREADGNWRALGDTDNATFTTASTWFDNVYQPA